MQAEGLALAEQSLARMPQQWRREADVFPWSVGEAYAQMGEVDRAWQTIVEAQSVCERTAEHSWDAELHRIAGEILVVKGADAGDVEAVFQQAIQTRVGKARRVSSFVPLSVLPAY